MRAASESAGRRLVLPAGGLQERQSWDWLLRFLRGTEAGCGTVQGMRELLRAGGRVAGCGLVFAVMAGAVGSLRAQTAETKVQALSARFWAWRAGEQPFSDDDIPRLDRAAGFTQQWSAGAVAGYERRVGEFETEWRAVDVAGAPVAVQVDWRLLGSAIARVRWELEVNPVWRRNPAFYVDQGLGGVYLAMLPPAPISAARQKDVVARLESVPRLLDEGRANLADMRQPFAVVAMEEMDGIEGHMAAFKAGVHAEAGFAPDELRRFDVAEEAAARAVVAYREWLRPQVAGLKVETAIGREAYVYFLRNVALLSYTPEQILAMGRAEWARAVTFEALAAAANKGLAETPMYASQAAQIAEADTQERAIRAYLPAHGLLSNPPEVRHYHSRAMPSYVAALSFLGVTDDLTSEARLGEDSVSYKLPPPQERDFFSAITAHDTRPLTIHEGVPGHAFQLAWSWHNADPVRRHYYDSESNEGIGFYAEEMMLIGGLFDGEPRTKEAIYRMMRLRALRVEVDVRLALGEFTLAQAAAYLEKTVPMDQETARGEASMFASTPGQAITYQIGKSDLVRLVADARVKQGEGFRLQAFDDAVWMNGNVPFSLDRWEMLGDKSEVPAVAGSFAWR